MSRYRFLLHLGGMNWTRRRGAARWLAGQFCTYWRQGRVLHASETLVPQLDLGSGKT